MPAVFIYISINILQLTKIPNLLWSCWQLCVATEGEGGDEKNEVSDRLCRLGVGVLLQLEQELGQKYVALACPEVVE